MINLQLLYIDPSVMTYAIQAVIGIIPIVFLALIGLIVVLIIIKNQKK